MSVPLKQPYRRWVVPLVVEPPSPEYGFGGLNYAKTRKLKNKSDEAKTWQDANLLPLAVDPL